MVRGIVHQVGAVQEQQYPKHDASESFVSWTNILHECRVRAIVSYPVCSTKIQNFGYFSNHFAPIVPRYSLFNVLLNLDGDLSRLSSLILFISRVNSYLSLDGDLNRISSVTLFILLMNPYLGLYGEALSRSL